MWAHEWPAGSTVGIEVFDGITSLGQFSATVNQDGNFDYYFESLDLVSGYTVVVTEPLSGISREHIIEYVRVTSYDTAANLVHGKSNPGALLEVIVNLGDDDWDNWPRLWDVEADEHGNWTADFSGKHDIVDETVIQVFIHDEHGNQTFLYQGRNPEGSHNVGVNPVQNFIEGSNWPLAEGIAIVIDRGGTTVHNGQAMPNEWGDFWYEPELIDIQAGDQITLSQDGGIVSTSHTVIALTITVAAGDTVSGTAAADSTVYLYPMDWDIGSAEIVASSAGEWSHTFSANIEGGGWAVQRDGYNNTWLQWPEDIITPDFSGGDGSD